MADALHSKASDMSKLKNEEAKDGLFSDPSLKASVPFVNKSCNFTFNDNFKSHSNQIGELLEGAPGTWEGEVQVWCERCVRLIPVHSRALGL